MRQELMEPLSGLRGANGELTTGHRPNRTLRQRNARIARAFDLAGKRALDLGCAEGLHSLYMAESAAEVVGIDHRSSVISRANANKKALGAANVTFECADIRDPGLLSRLGKFDLVVAWGFLHRVTDIFSVLEAVGPITNAFSLEWRTPVFPLMSRFSLAYHSPAGTALDPMNLGPVRAEIEGADPSAPRPIKIEGDTGFWEPTPGAVRIMCRRVGFGHARLLGYGESLSSEGETVLRHWGGHLLKTFAGRAIHQVPLARVHMVFEKVPGSIKIRDPYGHDLHLPDWDQGLHLSVARQKAHSRRMSWPKSRSPSQARKKTVST